jgi:hypothetical protein
MATSINSNFVPGNGSWDYPTATQLNFGTDFAGSEYIIPVVRFEFFNSLGESTESSSPIIYIKMGGTFQSSLSNQWNPAANIYGNPSAGVEDTGLGVIQRMGGSFYEALQKQLMNAVGSAAGAFASAGQSGKANFEFLQRKLFNNFQQLIYSGPTFRQFSLPFSMKPTSLVEAQAMRDIIQTFRIASSPRTSESDPSNDPTKPDDGNTYVDELSDSNDGLGLSGSDFESGSGSSGTASYTGAEFDLLIASTGQTKLFGYPDMCKFQLLLYNHTMSELAILFESNLCVIESVATDYGSGNKMTFFDGDQYFPTDVTLNLGLKETRLLTASDVYASYSNHTIF